MRRLQQWGPSWGPAGKVSHRFIEVAVCCLSPAASPQPNLATPAWECRDVRLALGLPAGHARIGRHLLAAFREGALNSSIRLSTLPSARPAIAPGGFVTRWPTKPRPRTTQSGQHSSEAGRQAGRRSPVIQSVS